MNEEKSNMIAVKCPACGTLFGYESNGILNIKHRDLFRQIQGFAKGPCRRCGSEVTWGSVVGNNTDHTRPR